MGKISWGLNFHTWPGNGSDVDNKLKCSNLKKLNKWNKWREKMKFILPYLNLIWKCIKMRTNIPSIGAVILEIASWILDVFSIFDFSKHVPALCNSYHSICRLFKMQIKPTHTNPPTYPPHTLMHPPPTPPTHTHPHKWIRCLEMVKS